LAKWAVAGRELYTNEAIAALPVRDPERLSREFLKYALSATSHVDGANDAVLGKVLNRSKVANISIPLPPLTEQQRIVSLLDRADEMRKLRAQADSRTADLIAALFHGMFGHHIKSPPILDSLEDAAAPNGWRWSRLTDVARLATGHTPSRRAPEYWKREHPLDFPD